MISGFEYRPAIRAIALVLGVLLFNFALVCRADDSHTAAHFREQVQPILENHCFACHGYGEKKGGHAFDEFKSDQAILADKKLWLAVLKNVRSGLMPPKGEDRLTDDEKQRLFDWIELEAFTVDPADPDPGRVTLRRLNRVEYRNTIRDLTGVDYDTSDEFPADDSGYGFDTVGDAMSLSPLLMEKYISAAETIVAEAVPTAPVNPRIIKEYEKYRRIFVNGPAPAEVAKRDAYAREILSKFAKRAYRRPVDNRTLDRLVGLAKAGYTAPGQTFEGAVGRAVVAILASPRFLFRIEGPARASDAEKYPAIDEFSLASRLSYFLWSTMPDNELMRLAERGELRKNLGAQIERMLNDRRSQSLSDNFAGQWLRARDIETMEIEPISAMGLGREQDRLRRELRKMRHEQESQDNDASDGKTADAKNGDRKKDGSKTGDRWQDREQIRAEYRKLAALKGMFNTKLRQAMRDETLAYFNYIVRENRDVIELVDSNYTFVNATLAKHYGIEGVTGGQVRRVELPPGSPRGGILTQGTILAVTSNPTRTSPVKRGLFILDNILATPPPPPPPPNIPLLEVARDSISDHEPTIRESQELHRRAPLCKACHARMDPLGLALENFNAMGMWRDKEQGQPIDASGELMTGEKFNGIRELKTIIKSRHRLDFYRCLAEKLLTYALGRGLEYYDEHTVDLIVARLDRRQGKFDGLVRGIVESAPFQKQRRAKDVAINP
jgi:hypothetical protein